MAYMAEDKDMTLLVFHDENISYPSKKTGNFSTMYTWPKDVSVGDDTSIDYPDVFLMEKVWDVETPDKTIQQAMAGKFKDLSLTRNATTKQWELTSYSYFERKNSNTVFESEISYKELEYELTVCMWHQDLHRLASAGALIMPVYYEGTQLSTGEPTPHWDNRAQQGYIFATHDEIAQRFGDITEETLKQAQLLIEEEMCVNNHYENGNVYSCRLFQGGEQIFEQDGLVGDITKVISEIQDLLPNHRNLAQVPLNYVDQNEIDDFLYSILH